MMSWNISNFVVLLELLWVAIAAGNSIGNPTLVEPFSDPDLSTVQYLLWTSSNPGDEDFYVLEKDDSNNLAASPFDGSKRTYFVIHGFNSNGETSWILDIKSNILSIEDANVISVDYRVLADVVNYEKAVSDMYPVANLTASYVDWLCQETPLTTANIHITGHSLGAHCAGMTAKYATAGLIDRISGLDPAGPLFYSKDSTKRLDKSDASFVDVIHTNACPIYSSCAGLHEAIGHVDFYPNGGVHQPGCTLPGDIPGENWIDLFSGCSHGRAHAYWVESIMARMPGGTGLAFVSWPCADWETFEAGGCPDCGQGCLEMGFHVTRSLEGLYFLTTKTFSPFANGASQT